MAAAVAAAASLRGQSGFFLYRAIRIDIQPSQYGRVRLISCFFSKIFIFRQNNESFRCLFIYVHACS